MNLTVDTGSALPFLLLHVPNRFNLGNDERAMM